VLFLEEGGLTNGAALVGGLDAWLNQGYPLETGLPRPVQP
jgi:rhodanese-related sulfurtransferase